MIFQFNVYQGGISEIVRHERADVEGARGKACRLLSQSTDRIGNELVRGEQVRVVVSNDQGLELFTLAYVVSGGALRDA